MNKLLIEGGVELQGKVSIAGAKNAALPIMMASLMTADEVTLSNIPDLRDVTQTLKLLGVLGVKRTFNYEEKTITLNSEVLTSSAPDATLVQSMRASVMLLGPLLTRFGEVKLYQPGGCVIGPRPIDLHIKGMQAMGAKIIENDDYIIAKANKLIGATIHFPITSVTGTENIICAACLAQGTTTIHNAAMEPEITDLINCLKTMGAKISGAGTNCLTIKGVKHLHGTEYRVIPDRIEAGTYMIASAMTGGNIELEGIQTDIMQNIITVLKKAGVKIIEKTNTLIVERSSTPLKSVNITTSPYPGFPTDMQAQMMSLNCIAEGVATIEDTVFKNRFHHVKELCKMGAKLEQNQNKVTCRSKNLFGSEVKATDLRASACLILAALVAEGKSVIHDIQHIDRGYEKIEEKLGKLGASISRLHDNTT